MTFFEEYFKGCSSNPVYIEQGINIVIAKQIEDFMKKNSISELDLAMKLKRSKTYVIKLLRGDIPLTILLLAKLSVIFKTQLNIILMDK